MVPHKYVCERCGSDDVEMEAFAYWNIALQEFEYEAKKNSDYDYCYKCENSTRIDQRDLVDLKDIALVAAHKPIFKSVRS